MGEFPSQDYTAVQPKDHFIAIIGMGAVFPASNGLKEYWRLIFNGDDAITDIPEESHWSLKDYFDENPATPDHTYCKRGGFIPKINFDPAKYGFPPNNLEATDTSQLLGLMVAEMALADAGYPANCTDSISNSGNHLRTSVILGVTGTQELVIPLGARLYHPVWKRALQESGITGEKHDEIIQRISDSFPKWQENSFPGLLGNVVAGRIANRLNLGGTNTVVDSACASSLSAIHTACLELASGRCDLSLSGGVDALNDIFMHICFSKTGVLSHTSDAKPFSKDADGTVLGEGVGMVVLKRLEDAERDNDRIYAVIRGIGTSSDGKTGGIYAPDAGGQLRALKSAYQRADIDPCTVELFEAHGTGTRVGDKIEFTALKSLFAEPAINNCENISNLAAVGSVKSMIGHAKAAAGAAGLIKAVLSLHNKVIPPTLKAENPDPEIDITNSSFYLNSLLKPWVKSDTHPRRCGVSAFGFGGSNFHLVLEEYNENKEHVSWDGSVQIAAFSASTKEKLRESLIKFRESMEPCKHGSSKGLDSNEKAQLVGWKTSQSRKEFSAFDPYRLLIVITDKDDPADKASEALVYLDSSEDISHRTTTISGDRSEQNRSGIFYDSRKKTGEEEKEQQKKVMLPKKRDRQKGKIAFLFPGQGSQYAGMGRELISMFPEALETLELAERSFKNQETDIKNRPRSLKDYLFPPPLYAQDEKTSEDKLRATDVAQPAIGAVSLAMTKILARFGVKPDVVCGHSFGELTALCAAGWIDDATFFNLASQRGKLMADAAGEGEDPGTMFAVKASPYETGEIIKSENLDLVIANINSPNQVVLSGKTDEIKRAAKIFKSRKLRGVQLPVAAAFHSTLVEKAVAPFKKIVSSIQINCSDGSNPSYKSNSSDEFNHSKISKIKVFSNTTGKPYPEEDEPAKQLLGEQLINPVCFMSDIESMLQDKVTTFIEVGPKTVLTGLTRSILESTTGNQEDRRVAENRTIADAKDINCLSIDSSAGKKRAVEDLACLLCSLAASGVEICLDRWENPVEKPAQKKMRIPLTGANVKPKYQHLTPFAKQTHTPEKQSQSPARSNQTSEPKQVHLHNPNQIVNRRTIIRQSKTIASSSTENRGYDMTNRYNSQSTENEIKSYKPFDKHGMERHSDKQQPIFSSYNQPSPFVYSAMQMVQKGMESMQELQTRTALAHEKFLDTQAVASRTLQAMMEQTRFFAENAIYSLNNNNHQAPPPRQPNPNDGVDSPNVVAFHHAEQLKIDQSARNRERQESIRIEQEPVRTESAHKILHSSGNNGKNNQPLNLLDSGVTMHHNNQNQHHNRNEHHNQLYGMRQTETLLLETVSKLTGFPVEMLTLDMDIESDLGIDSIKRVEILSELEKNLPGTDALTPENMGTLRTLKDICHALAPAKQEVAPVINTFIPKSHVSKGNSHVQPPANKTLTAQSSVSVQSHVVAQQNKQHSTDKNVMKILMETISTLTGFPVEMLSPDMDIESDLGIDSIKRVEILSQLEEQLPEAEQIKPDDLGRLKTIEQIAQHISVNNVKGNQVISDQDMGKDNQAETMEYSESVSCQRDLSEKKNS